ncbi:MAG TPA: DUF928 domain-containing protein [Coleofasciculaceae cyanobacterium]
MNCLQHFFRSLFSTCLVLLLLGHLTDAVSGEAPLPAITNSQLIAFNPLEWLRSILWPPPKKPPVNVGVPSGGRRDGGGTSGFCPAVSARPAVVLALVPTPADAYQPFGQTTSGHPTFWFYVPYQGKRLAEFVLIDEQENDVYNSGIFTIDQGQIPGIIGVKLPDQVPPLQVGKQYRWIFSIVCSRSDRSGDMTVNGWIQRIEPDKNLQNQLSQAQSSTDKLLLLARNGIWFDALTPLMELRRQQPSSTLDQIWGYLLESIQMGWDAKDIDGLGNSPISSCCGLNQQPAR